MNIRRMLRLSRQQIERMRQQRQNRLERALRPCRAARKIHNQAPPYRSAHPAAQRSKRSLPQPFSSHPLGQPLDQPFAHQPRRLGRHVTSSKPCPTRRHHQLSGLNPAAQRRGDRLHLVRDDLRGNRPHTRLLQQVGHRRPRQIIPLAVEAPIAHRNHHCPNLGTKSRAHPVSLRPSFACQMPSHPAKDEKIKRGDANSGHGTGSTLSLLKRNFAAHQPSDK